MLNRSTLAEIAGNSSTPALAVQSRQFDHRGMACTDPGWCLRVGWWTWGSAGVANEQSAQCLIHKASSRLLARQYLIACAVRFARWSRGRRLNQPPDPSGAKPLPPPSNAHPPGSGSGCRQTACRESELGLASVRCHANACRLFARASSASPSRFRSTFVKCAS